MVALYFNKYEYEKFGGQSTMELTVFALARLSLPRPLLSEQ